ncbi:hypothetical protein QJS10_CPB17g00237 [Acorus calamus]|uniref:Complex 1 LYR protein domain-containing protein n=1 Tax=Acorus calamus TaxID=4465 RepID=A0AAV9CTE5_ACOCL|nr:hypothetical protein QJS10_CPB17g00237 [Acorus calamus]
MASRTKLSGLQKQGPEERQRIESIVSAKFHQNSKNIDRKNFLQIEYLLRQGKKQLDQLKSPDTVGLSSFRFSQQ